MPAPLRLHPLLTLAGALLLPLATTQGQALPPPSQAIAVQATPTYHHGNTEMAGYLIEEAPMVCFGPEILEGIGSKVATRARATAGELATAISKEASVAEEHAIIKKTLPRIANEAGELGKFDRLHRGVRQGFLDVTEAEIKIIYQELIKDARLLESGAYEWPNGINIYKHPATSTTKLTLDINVKKLGGKIYKIRPRK